ncbi:peptidylprolyl isomerase [Sphingomonas melonis]|uniref:peptidylprolyl isomerase n=1 Tax=Sphingomonas melonis TaxID=152682 RepID=A0A7Y9FSJ3_9SPHN|nr:peptidylprolyl isomerase [Sphingomonas melonis]NYD91471.1 peptidyl-prolyl cis-trans isomerase A (cyclophilin A) [Sphingomonas melonis]
MRLSLILLATAAMSTATPAAAPREPAVVRVRLDTPYGPIVLALEARRAPRTVANFMGYVDDGRFDGMSFYRSARNRSKPGLGFIQGGIRTDARRILPSFPLETTAMTGLRHVDGTISMARRAEAGSAGGNFFITVGAMPSMDAKGSYPGYAAFGHVVSGMAVVKRILAMPTGGGMGGQLLLKPVQLTAARRLTGTPHPTGLVKPWLVKTSDGRRN